MPVQRPKRKGKGKPAAKTAPKPPQKAAKPTRTYGLGERNPETLPNGLPAFESHHENIRNTKRWNRIRAEVMTGGSKYTGHGG